MSLEAAITLDDVFAVVGAKRVPLAAELAGYLALEIADGTDAGSGDVDPKTVFISEEGTVALVRPKKEIVTGDSEASVRGLLVRLLEASGSSTPALGAAARRKPGNGLPALVEELEAALIPVNRSAGRRALARLSREVKRVTQGVGRNASAAPVPPAAAPAPKPEVVEPPPPPPPKPISVPPPPPPPVPKEPTPPPPQRYEAEPKHDPLAATPIAPKPSKSTSIPPPPGHASVPPPPPPQPVRPPGPPSALFAEGRVEPESEEAIELTPTPTPSPDLPEPTPSPRRPPPKKDDIDALLNSFEVSSVTEDKQLARDLKAMAGLSPTPPNPEAKTLADLARDVGKGPMRPSATDEDSVAQLLALADASLPAPAVTANHPPVNTKPAAGAPAIIREKSDVFDEPPAKNEVPPAKRSAPAFARQKSEVFDDPDETPQAKRSTPAFRRTLADAEPPAPTARRRQADDPPRAPKTSMVLLVIALLALGGATAAIYRFAPHVFTGHRPLPTGSSPIPSATAVVAPVKQCRLTLVVTDAPAKSEVLLRVGQAPVDVDQMPVGARLELVATAEGYAPRRAVIPAEAVWDKGADGKPRIEVPIQLDPSHPKPGTLDPWPGAEPSSEVGGSGAPGTVHVVSNVRGAEIWLMAGLGPSAQMEQGCGGDVDVLVASPGPTTRKRLHVGDKEIAAAAPDAKGNKTVTLSAAK